MYEVYIHDATIHIPDAMCNSEYSILLKVVKATRWDTKPAVLRVFVPRVSTRLQWVHWACYPSCTNAGLNHNGGAREAESLTDAVFKEAFEGEMQLSRAIRERDE
jgi:hypothetical protein